MKKMKNIMMIAACAVIVAFSSCSKDDPDTPYDCTTCVSAPEAIAANDNSTKGIYKGFIIGSSGTIKFDIANNGQTITAVMVIDGVTVNLTSSIAWISGEPYVAPFTGMMNGNPVSITFSVDVSGENPTVTAANIPGHPNATIAIVKETSDALVETFEGTYSTTDPETGNFNIIVARSLNFWTGASRATGDTLVEPIEGIIQANKLYETPNNLHVGTLDGDRVTGSFINQDGETVTVTGQRTQ